MGTVCIFQNFNRTDIYFFFFFPLSFLANLSNFFKYQSLHSTFDIFFILCATFYLDNILK